MPDSENEEAIKNDQEESSDSTLSPGSSEAESNASSKTSEKNEDFSDDTISNEEQGAPGGSDCISCNSVTEEAVNDLAEVSPEKEETEDFSKSSHILSPKFLAGKQQAANKPERYTVYKSMNFLSFTTRMGMLQDMSEVKVVDNNPRQAVHVVDSIPPELSKKKCQVLKYWTEDKLVLPSAGEQKGATKDQALVQNQKRCTARSSSVQEHAGRKRGRDCSSSSTASNKLMRLQRSDSESDAAEMLVALANSHCKAPSAFLKPGPFRSEPASPASHLAGQRVHSEPASPTGRSGRKPVMLPSMVSILGKQQSGASTSAEATSKEVDFDEFANAYHSISQDTIGNPIHKCNVCNKVFTIYEAYYGHVYTHYKHRNKCFVCGKIFTRSWLLKGHMRTHTGERPYKCEYLGCNRAFADRSNLRSHMMIHQTKDKGHICCRCNRAFAQKRYLHKHQLEVCKVSSPGKSCTPATPVKLVPTVGTNCTPQSKEDSEAPSVTPPALTPTTDPESEIKLIFKVEAADDDNSESM